MKPIIDTIECQRDSPYFRQTLEENERNIENLEHKLEKIIKQCSQMVTAGKVFNMEQEQLVHSMWELSSYFSDDSVVQGSLNCLLDALREAVNYHKILIDQAARAIMKNFNGFIKEEVKALKEKRHWFEKASLEMDTVLHRHSTTSKANENEEMNKQVWATRQAFRHTAIDYTHAISMVQAKKRHEIVDAILSYTKSYSTFYHQGFDLCNDMKPSLDKISREVHEMREEVGDLDKSMENRHFDISGKALVSLNENRNSVYPVSMQGYLFKRTNNAFKSWNRRYFTLQNNQLVYRKRSGEEVTVMEEDLRLCSVKPAVDMERRFCFEITSNIKSHVLQAESEESCQMWIEAMSRAISSAIQHNEHPYPSADGNNDSPIDVSNSSICTSPADSPANSKECQGASGAKSMVWKEILKIPGNNVCCDCGSTDPKWASINLGITLCIECSGIHRSLGVHYSKVRSLTLDKWDLEVFRVMEKLGNEIVNQIYLSNDKKVDNLRNSFQGNYGEPNLLPATAQCSRIVRESWIKAKYVDKMFVTPISNEKAFAKILNHSKTYGRQQKGRRSIINSPQEISRLPDSPVTSPGLLSCSSSSSSLEPGGESSPSPLDTPPMVPQDGWNEVLSENALRMESLTPNNLLITASSLGHLPLMCLSIALGASKNYQNNEGRTALHQAIYSRSAISVEYLLLNGVHANIQDNNGQTPLHLAAIEANILQVYRLIKYRADWKTKDKEGKTPVDHAVQSSEPDLVTLLRVATLSEQLDKEQVEEEMMTIMQDLYRKKNHLMDDRSGE